ncbi:peroxiredoxin [Thermonema lapsum]|uniref:Peroxiredoxin n=1 Tax=Thermonema lapsum TaxID=28195 RepID=A0A846MS59_9BACT|nr:thioredoxin family protein [Thermonema lapsum]NIK74271.1 peroxiredoxin [Thermonema lapsum]
MRKYLLTLLLLSFGVLTWAQGYKPGDKAIDFKLKNIDGQYVSLADFKEAKGFIVVFTCNHCPFSKMYEDRIIALDKKYKPLGYPVVAINPNDPKKQPEDSFDKMIERAKEKGFTFPYLFDETQEIARTYGATNTPHVFVLKKEGKDLIVSYIGAIDDSPREASKASKKYVEQAVDALLSGKEVQVKQAKAIGCTIKWKEM